MEIEIKPFTKVLEDSTRKFKKIPKGDYLKEGRFPIIDQSLEFIAGYTDDDSLVNFENLPVIIFGDHTRSLKYIDFPIALGADGAKALTLKNNEHNVRYLYYALKNLDIPNAGYSRHFKFLKESKLSLPIDSINQKRIAQVLSDCEELIAKRKESIELLDELVKSTFLEMFGDPIRNEMDWNMDTLENVVAEDCPLTYGIVQPGEEFQNGVPVVRPVDLKDDFVNLEGLKLIDPIISNKFRRTLLKGGEILLVVRGTTGVVCIAEKELEGANVTRGITPIWLTENMNNRFVLHLIKSKPFQNLIAEKTYGIALKQINLRDVRVLPIITPPENLQKEFTDIANNVEDVKKLYQSHLFELENLYARLSQDAFKGELDLSHVVLREEFLLEKQNEISEIKDEVEKPKEKLTKTEIKKLRKEAAKKRLKVDITNMTLADYFRIPKHLQETRDKIDFDFIGDNVFYQFALIKHFNIEDSFTYQDILEKMHHYFYNTGDMDIDYETWKKIIFKFIEQEPPIIEQVFDEKESQIKLKLTNEAFKA